MKRRQLILGPPGTGKTTTLLREIEGIRALGYGFEDIGFASLTRRAIQEARERAAGVFGCGPDDVPWFRTLHSAFARRLNMRNWLSAADLKEFGEQRGYQLTVDAGGDFLEEGWSAPTPSQTDDDKLRAADDYARIRRVSLDQAASVVQVHVQRLKAFSEAYRRFKWGKGKADYTDVLEEAVARQARLPVRVLIVDEAQDLSPLQIAALRPTIEAADIVIVAGDDDQAIFTFAGSEPDWLIELSQDSQWETRVLSQSYRVPRLPHAMAQRIIGRNSRRVAKEYAPRPVDGEVIKGMATVAEYLEVAGQAAYLARTRNATKDIAEELFRRQTVPYVIHRGAGPNPLGKPSMLQAVKAAEALVEGRPMPRQDLVNLLKYVPSRGPAKLLPHGAKARVEAFQSPTVSHYDIEAFGLHPLRDHAREHGRCSILLSKVSADERAWLQAMCDRYGGIPDPLVTISTIHSTKGAEWPTVVLCPDHPKPVEEALRCPRGRESEHRVAYVAVTRAKARLVIARRSGSMGYPYP